jgi:hypothetical protein
MVLWVLVVLLTATVAGLAYNGIRAKARDAELQKGYIFLQNWVERTHPGTLYPENPILGK